MRAAAKLGRETVRELHHPHLVAVLFAEEGHGVVLADGHVDGHVFQSFDLGVAQHFAVHDGLNFLKFLIGHLGKVGKVEAQPRRVHGRAGLLHVRAQNLTQSRVQQVGSGVIAADGVAAGLIDHGIDAIPNHQRLLEQSLVGAHALHRQHAARDLGHGRIAVGRGKPAGIARLPAGVAVEAGLVENHVDLVASLRGGNAHAVLHNGQDFCAGGGELLVAQKVGLGQFAIGRAGGLLAATLPRSAGAGLLLGAGGFKAVQIEAYACVVGCIRHKVDGKSVRLIKVEGSVARQNLLESVCFS